MSAFWTKYLPSFLRERLEGRQQLQKALGNAGWLLSDKIFRMGVALLIGVWTARYLGPKLYGQLSYALAFTMLFCPISDLGLDGIVQREILLDPTAKDKAIGTSFVLTAIGGLLSFILAVTGIFIVRPSDGLTHALVAILSIGAIFQAFIAIEYWYESQVESKRIVAAKFSAFLISNVLKLALIVLKAPLIAFAWVSLAEAGIGAAGLVIIYNRDGYRISSWKFSTAATLKFLRISWPIILSGIMTTISMRIDQVMLGEMIGETEVGIYSVAVRLTEAWFFIPLTACSSAFPAIMNSWAGDKELFYKQIQKLYNLMAFIGYCIAIPVTIFSGWIIKLLFGAAYYKSGPLLSVLIWTVIVMNLGSARTLYLISMNWTKLLFITLLFGSVLNILLNLILIPRYGAVGAAISTIISYWLASHGSCFLFKPLRKTGWMLARAIVYPKFW
jgi:O-antigen/teichoic acid export membrane protein